MVLSWRRLSGGMFVPLEVSEGKGGAVAWTGHQVTAESHREQTSFVILFSLFVLCDKRKCVLMMADRVYL